LTEQEPTEFELAKHQAEKDRARFQIEAVRSNLLTEMRGQILNEGSKGLVLINGGGAAALAAFSQAIWDKSEAASMRWWLLFGICWLLVGTATASMIFLARYFGSRHLMTNSPKQNPWWWTQLTLTICSVALFIIGMGVAVAGGFIALGHR
jgi:hypothetical protein